MSVGEIPRDRVRVAIKDVFDRPGRTIREIERSKRRKVRESAQETLRDEPVWYSRAEFLDPIAKKLNMHSSLWGRRRKSNDFYEAVDQEISKLRNRGAISDWEPRSGVFRLSGHLPANWTDASPSEPAYPTTEIGIGSPINTFFVILLFYIMQPSRLGN